MLVQPLYTLTPELAHTSPTQLVPYEFTVILGVPTLPICPFIETVGLVLFFTLNDTKPRKFGSDVDGTTK